MAKTLLTAVNDTLKRVKQIQGDSGELTTFADSPRQNYIDTAIQIWNEIIVEVYTISELPLPGAVGSSSVVLSATREYTLPGDLEQIRYPLIDEVNGRFIAEYPGGFEAMRRDQPQPSTYLGTPNFAVINPETGLLRLDVVPDGDTIGETYQMVYDKTISLTATTDLFPFQDSVVDALMPAVAEMWKKEQQGSFDSGVFGFHLGRAARLITKVQPRQVW